VSDAGQLGEGLPSTDAHGSPARIIGASGEGRPIALHELSSPASPPIRLLVFGGIHGDEPSSVDAVVELVARATRLVAGAVPRLAEGGGERSSPSVESGGRLWLLPALNPDGLAAGRKNSASDVDLNRNFPARSFAPSGDRSHAPGYDPGPRPLSEPETAALARFLDEERVEAVVAVHAPFACVNYDGPADAWAEAVSTACGWPVRPQIGYPTPGSLGSWLGIDRGIPILTLELPGGPLASFRAQAAAALDRAVGYWSERLTANR